MPPLSVSLQCRRSQSLRPILSSTFQTEPLFHHVTEHAQNFLERIKAWRGWVAISRHACSKVDRYYWRDKREFTHFLGDLS